MQMEQKPRMGDRFASLCASAFLLLCTAAWAADPDLPKGAGPLPDVSAGAKAGALVTSQHAHLYRMLLPREVADLLEQGELAFEAVRSPKEPSRFVRIVPQLGELESSGVLRSTSGFSPLPHGLFALGEGISVEPTLLAFKVLWNSAASMWRYRSFAVGVSMYLFQRSEMAPRKLEFEVERIHPLSLGVAPGTLAPVFREKISARKPAAINGLSWLTLRFFGTTEDFVWVGSPITRSIRQMTGSNRSDQIFSAAFAPDDLFVWSGKVEAVEPRDVSQVALLVPILEVKDAGLSKQESCVTRTFVAESGLALQCESPRFTGTGGWIPTNTVMALRNLWRVDLVSRDPFSAEPRQTLYVDQSSHVPVYRLVWDQAGRLKRVTIGILRSVDVGPQERDVILAGQTIVHAQDGRRVALVYDSLSYCEEYGPRRKLTDFDPSSFVVFEKETPADKKLAEEPKSEDSLD